MAAVIFDFDGIIVDTEPLHYKAFQEVLVPLGLGYSWKEYLSRYIGFDDRDAFREVFRENGKVLSNGLADLIARKAAAFNRIIADGVDPYPGVLDLVKSIKEHCPVALCSGALRTDIDPILLQLGIGDAFDTVVSAEDVETSKPHPESYSLSVRKLGALFPELSIVPEACIAVEDTPAGIASARGAGLKVLAVTNSYPAEKLAGATKIVNSLSDVDCRFLFDLS